MRWAFALVAVAACGDDVTYVRVDAAIDAPPDAVIDAPVTGVHYHYIVDAIRLPGNSTEAQLYALDIDGNGQPDNRLGQAISTLQSMGLPLAAATASAVDTGDVLVLADLSTPDFMTAPLASFHTLVGSLPMPPSCTSPTDPVCRHHLDGAGTFTAVANPFAPVYGPVASGALVAGPGRMVFQLAFRPTTPITLTLYGARVAVTTTDANTLGESLIGGAITPNDVTTKLIPGIRAAMMANVVRDCTQLATPPACGCVDPSSGKTLIGMFDATQDCDISRLEIQNNSLIGSVLSPDVVVEGQPMVSFGVGFTAVHATF